MSFTTTSYCPTCCGIPCKCRFNCSYYPCTSDTVTLTATNWPVGCNTSNIVTACGDIFHNYVYNKTTKVYDQKPIVLKSTGDCFWSADCLYKRPDGSMGQTRWTYQLLLCNCTLHAYLNPPAPTLPPYQIRPPFQDTFKVTIFQVDFYWESQHIFKQYYYFQQAANYCSGGFVPEGGLCGTMSASPIEIVGPNDDSCGYLQTFTRPSIPCFGSLWSPVSAPYFYVQPSYDCGFGLIRWEMVPPALTLWNQYQPVDALGNATGPYSWYSTTLSQVNNNPATWRLTNPITSGFFEKKFIRCSTAATGTSQSITMMEIGASYEAVGFGTSNGVYGFEWIPSGSISATEYLSTISLDVYCYSPFSGTIRLIPPCYSGSQPTGMFNIFYVTG